MSNCDLKNRGLRLNTYFVGFISVLVLAKIMEIISFQHKTWFIIYNEMRKMASEAKIM